MSDGERAGKPQQIDSSQLRQVKPRLTVVENIYYQVPGDEPEHYPGGFTRILDSDEQPYTRRIKIGPEWKTLDFGWVKEVGLFILENRGLPRMQFIQAPEDTPDPKSLAVRVRLGEPAHCLYWLVPVGESARFTPGFDIGGSFSNPVQVCCDGGEIRCMLHVIPR